VVSSILLCGSIVYSVFVVIIFVDLFRFLTILCVPFSDPYNKYYVRGTPYKFALQNKSEFKKVCHFFYKSFSERFQVVKPGGIA
jgi:hypothetical protein